MIATKYVQNEIKLSYATHTATRTCTFVRRRSHSLPYFGDDTDSLKIIGPGGCNSKEDPVVSTLCGADTLLYAVCGDDIEL